MSIFAELFVSFERALQGRYFIRQRAYSGRIFTDWGAMNEALISSSRRILVQSLYWAESEPCPAMVVHFADDQKYIRLVYLYRSLTWNRNTDSKN